MTPERRTNRPEDDEEFGVLGIPTAQVSVTLPAPSDEDLADDDVVDDKSLAHVFDEDPPALVPEPMLFGRIHEGSEISDIVIELPASPGPEPSGPQTSPGAPMLRIDELEAHFATRVRRVVRLPYDPAIAAGSVLGYAGLRSETRAAARELAAVVVEGLREADR